MDRFIPLSVPNFEGNEKKYINNAVDDAWVSTGGPYVAEFEKKLASYIKVKNVAVCQSGTSALHLSLIEAGLGCGDSVIVPALTFIASVNPVRYMLANPIFMDCDDSLCMDPVKLRLFLENHCIWDGNTVKYNNSRIKAIIVVHIFGNMADMESIMSIAKKYNLIVIEDATEALGTCYSTGVYAGKYAGTIGDFGCYSFNGNKIITTGGGGAVTSNISEKVDHIRFLSTQSKTDPFFYIHDEIGYNYRMTNLQAALGLAQLEELNMFIERKNDNYVLYNKYFEGFDLCKLLPFRKGVYSNKWFYSLVLNISKIDFSLKDCIYECKKLGFETRAIWGLINEQKPYLKFKAFMIDKAKHYSNCILNIPSSTQISNDEIEYVANQIKSLLEEHLCD